MFVVYIISLRRDKTYKLIGCYDMSIREGVKMFEVTAVFGDGFIPTFNVIFDTSEEDVFRVLL